MKRAMQTFMMFCLLLLILEGTSRALLSVKSINEAIRGYTFRTNACDATMRWDWMERYKNGLLAGHPYNQYDPIKGWGLIPNISGMKCFDNKFINSNSMGIRGGSEYSYAKDKGKLRILFLGDSFTFGDEVSDSETYPHYLQQMLPNVEVINMGMSGYGHDQMLISLEEEGVKYRPDIVILGFMSMDNERNVLAFSYYAKPKFELMNGQLRLRHVPVPPPDTVLKWEPWRSKFVDLLSLLRHSISVRWGAYAEEKEAVTNAILKKIVSTAEGIGAVPVFVYLDNVRSLEAAPEMTREEALFFNKCKDLSVPCVFLRQGVQSARASGLKIKEHGHFCPETNQLVALGIKDYLSKNGFLDRG